MVSLSADVSSASQSKAKDEPESKPNKGLPPPQASSTPKKQQQHVSKLKSNGFHTPFAKNGKAMNGRYDEESPLKKRRISYMNEDGAGDEDHGESFMISGRTVIVNGRSGKKGKGPKGLQEQRANLPIAKGKGALLKSIKENDTVVLMGETGSGKTTQVPQYILEAGLHGSGQIAVTQPRRIAATSLALRVAQEQDCELGSTVGYAVRFDEKANASTKIKYLTDGMLARELMADTLLKRYSVIIIDEAHERTLNTDILLANLKRIQRERKGSLKGKEKFRDDDCGPLKIVVMSATLDAEKFSTFFDGAKILYIKGRQHPVKIYYTVMTQADYVDSALRTFFQIHLSNPPGDVLIFLPGQDDIESLQHAINLYSRQLPVNTLGVLTCPMYASLPQSIQKLAFSTAPPDIRKCILATNIAETSITIPGVRYVIDTGKHKEKRHLHGGCNAKSASHIAHFNVTGLDTLRTEDISKSSAMQRAGRAGREGPGSCYRLYTETAFHSMPDALIPEILRSSLMGSALQLKCLDQDIAELELMDRPDDDAIGAALHSLKLLGALDGKRGALTPSGILINKFPIEPALARSVLAANEFGCMHEIIGIVSVLSTSSRLFFDISDEREAASEIRLRFRHASGDHLTALNALRHYEDLVRGGATKAACRDWCRTHFVNEQTLREAINIQEQLRAICVRLNMDKDSSSGDNASPVLKALFYGLVRNVAIYRPEEKAYRHTVSPSMMKIHPGSVLSDKKPPFIMYDELLFTQQKYARGVSLVEPSLFSEHPAYNPSLPR